MNEGCGITWEQIGIIVTLICAFCAAFGYVGSKIGELTKVIDDLKEKVFTGYVSEERCRERRENCACKGGNQ